MLLVPLDSIVLHCVQDWHVAELVMLLVRGVFGQVSHSISVDAVEAKGEDYNSEGVDHQAVAPDDEDQRGHPQSERVHICVVLPRAVLAA